ncbi:hypothetical protein P171DRAFT_438629 [Karstenula rhodostoma CBS 690.94]|uniref:Uncharacterized protein n=1 Tax=Karstenula rhodostoma CBS 690.94 TaxID=1392251 RepID=A0A9P4PZY9_9PLEO|nr:hypothetical protein P171DRAFT_438629 [Karstenula rhodostoma CBS 690.94]
MVPAKFLGVLVLAPIGSVVTRSIISRWVKRLEKRVSQSVRTRYSMTRGRFGLIGFDYSSALGTILVVSGDTPHDVRAGVRRAFGEEAGRVIFAVGRGDKLHGRGEDGGANAGEFAGPASAGWGLGWTWTWTWMVVAAGMVMVV